MPRRDEAVPFRWEVSRREQLGRLPEAPLPSPSWPPPVRFRALLPEVRSCAARVMARAGDARLVFVGRSLENLFDYSTGALADTAWRDRCELAVVSLRWNDDRAHREAREAFRAQLRAVGLAPGAIATAPRPVCFVDLVASGTTFGRLSDELTAWGRDEGVDVNAVRRRVRFVGIPERGKNSPNAWRWFQRVPWRVDYPRSALRGVSVPYWFWRELGDWQEKTVPSHGWQGWRTDAMDGPLRHPEHLRALRLAVKLHERGRTRDERERFCAELVGRPEMREPWLRSLVVQVRAR
ncbi:MAG TPA: hypothetical protein VEY93_05915 [Longimicrobium sp.]|nr:hypothetical protein [Longimicrobium sp.]